MRIDRVLALWHVHKSKIDTRVVAPTLTPEWCGAIVRQITSGQDQIHAHVMYLLKQTGRFIQESQAMWSGWHLGRAVPHQIVRVPLTYELFCLLSTYRHRHG